MAGVLIARRKPMPCDYSKYPKNWKTEIRPKVLERARDHCESCGVRNRAVVRRMGGNAAIYRYWAPAEGIFLDGDRRAATDLDRQEWSDPVKIVLTIAHVDQNVGNNSYANLAAWCQRCHLMFDARARSLVVRALEMVEEARARENPFDKLAGDNEKTKYSPARPEDLNVVKSIVKKKPKGRPRKTKKSIN